jgi:hypothetical protein
MKRRDMLARYKRDTEKLEQLLSTRPEGVRIEAAATRLGLTVARVHELAQDSPQIDIGVAVRSGARVARFKNVRDYILSLMAL